MRADIILYRVVEIIFDAIALLIGVRILLTFFNANSATPIVNWLYDISAPLVAPFAGMFPNATVGTFVIEISSIIALVVYSLIGYVVLTAIASLTDRFVTAHHDHAHAI